MHLETLSLFLTLLLVNLIPRSKTIYLFKIYIENRGS